MHLTTRIGRRGKETTVQYAFPRGPTTRNCSPQRSAKRGLMLKQSPSRGTVFRLALQDSRRIFRDEFHPYTAWVVMSEAVGVMLHLRISFICNAFCCPGKMAHHVRW